MYEDPFDQISAFLLALAVFIGGMIDLLLSYGWWSVWWRMRRSWLYVKYGCIRIHFAFRSVWIQCYYPHIRLWLEVLGVVPPMTWTDIEAYRLRMSARLGCEIPRPECLEQGLLQE